MKRRSAILAAGALLLSLSGVVACIFGTKTHRRQCNICGLQRYDRHACGIRIDAISEDAYDEGEVAQSWYDAHQGACKHYWIDGTIFSQSGWSQLHRAAALGDVEYVRDALRQSRVAVAN